MNHEHELFQYLHPCLIDNFYKLCIDGRIGLIPVSINKISFQKSKLLDSQYAYIFKIHIPYAGKTLGWEILFNPEDLTFGPDFDFNDDCFPQSMNIDELANQIPSLANWDLQNTNSLQAVLQEFLKLYKSYQIRELNNNNIYSRISDEYHLLMSAPDITADDVEFIIDNNSVQFLISVKMDVSNLPEYVQEVRDNGLLNPKEDFVLLNLIFHKLDASKVSINVQFSPRIDQLIGNRKKCIPSYDKDSSLVEYVPLISDIIQQEINEVVFHYQFKKEFITSLVALRDKSIIEYDTFNYNKIAFLCEVDNFYVLIQVIINEGFPKQKPIIRLNSLYCINPKNKLPCEKLLEFRHLPNQHADEMAKYLLEEIKGYIPEFKLHPHSITSRNQPN